MNKDNVLIIFVKNLIEGKVKTRLAKDIGSRAALQVYELLLKHTFEASRNLNAKVQIHYSDYVDETDDWQSSIFEKKIQVDGDLGQRMEIAIGQAFNEGAHKVVLIGSDCPSILPTDIANAFDILNDSDLAIGPSVDGGYYLIGMKKVFPQIFAGVEWSTSKVLNQTLSRAKTYAFSYGRLRVLNDIDTLNDLKKEGLLQHFIL